MGNAYLASIRVLPETTAGDPDTMLRSERETEAIAALSDSDSDDLADGIPANLIHRLSQPSAL